MERTVRQKLTVPLLMCIAFMAVGVSSITRGIESHQTWRIVSAALSEILFAGGILIIIFAIRKESKGLKNSQA